MGGALLSGHPRGTRHGRSERLHVAEQVHPQRFGGDRRDLSPYARAGDSRRPEGAGHPTRLPAVTRTALASGSGSADGPDMVRATVTATVLAVLLGAVGVLVGPLAVAATAAGTPAAILSSTTGPAGSTTTLTASGFPASAGATVTFAGLRTRLRTDARGRVTTRLSVPRTAAGTLRALVVTARGSAATHFTVSRRPSAARSPLRFGVTTPGGPTAAAELDAVTALAGQAPSIVMSYRGFAAEPDLTELDAVAARGAVPLVTWEPYDWQRGVDQPQYALARLRDGSYDAYLRRWADALRSWRKPVMLRFAHEMNGDWYPWAEGVNGNRPGDYVATWRHVHGIFTAAGATNVEWVWSPNAGYPGSTSLPRLYPGDAFVDRVALDGYNWGSTGPWPRWTRPGEIFDASLAELAVLAPGKPVLIAETASTELGGSKAAWIGELFDWWARRPQVTAVVWFHHDKETDWRIDSSPSAAAAFSAGLSRARR